MEDQLSRRIGTLIAARRAAGQQDRPGLGTRDADRRDACRLRHRRRDRLCRLPGAPPESQPPGAVFSFITALLLAYDPARRLARVAGQSGALAGQCADDLRNPRPEPQPGRCARRRGVGGRAPARCASIMSASPMSGACPCSTMSASPPRAGQDHRHRRRFGRRQVDADGAARSASTTSIGGRITIDGQDIAAVTKHSLRQVDRLCLAAALSVRGHASATTSATAAPTPPMPRSRRPRARRRPTSFIRAAAAGLRHAGRRKRRDAVRRPAPARCRSPAPSCAMRRSWCSTRRPRRSTTSPRRRLQAGADRGDDAAAPRSSSPTACRPWSMPTRSSCSITAGSSRKARIRPCSPGRTGSMPGSIGSRTSRVSACATTAGRRAPRRRLPPPGPKRGAAEMGAMKLVVVGAGGRMGQTLIRTIAGSEVVAVCGAIERPGAAALGRDAGELAGVGLLGVSVSDDPLPAFAQGRRRAGFQHAGRDRWSSPAMPRRRGSSMSSARPAAAPTTTPRSPLPRATPQSSSPAI